jgi:GT2 family glycosyltransferase
MATRRSVFEAVGGFDAEALPWAFNDIDYCLKVRRSGRLVRFEPNLTAVHQESLTLKTQVDDEARAQAWERARALMSARWGEAFHHDPSYNPHYARAFAPFTRLAEPSFHAIQAYMREARKMNPWRIG